MTRVSAHPLPHRRPGDTPGPLLVWSFEPLANLPPPPPWHEIRRESPAPLKMALAPPYRHRLLVSVETALGRTEIRRQRDGRKSLEILRPSYPQSEPAACGGTDHTLLTKAGSSVKPTVRLEALQLLAERVSRDADRSIEPLIGLVRGGRGRGRGWVGGG